MVVVSPSSLQKILTSYYSTKNTLTMAKKVKTYKMMLFMITILFLRTRGKSNPEMQENVFQRVENQEFSRGAYLQICLAAACALCPPPPNFHLSTALYLSPYAKLYMQEQCVKTCTE